MKKHKLTIQRLKKSPNLSKSGPIQSKAGMLVLSNAELFREYEQDLHLLGYSAQTLAHKQVHLRHYQSWLGEIKVSETGEREVKAYYRYLQTVKASLHLRTVNLYMISIDKFYSWCCELGYCKTHPFVGIKLLKSEELESRTPVSKEEIGILYKACESKEEKLLLVFCYGCGLRASEVQHLKVRDVLTSKSMVLVRSGKNNKRRYVPLKSKHLDLMRAYILEKGLVNEDYLFVYKGRQKSQYLLRKIFRDLQERSGIKKTKYSLHHLRHSIASHLVEGGVSIRLVQQFLGHSNLETTQDYVSVETKISYGNKGIK